MCADAHGFVVNKDLFEKYDIPLPTDYESFVSACQAFDLSLIHILQQELAAEKLLSHSDGVLSAATAFGKTVVCSCLLYTSWWYEETCRTHTGTS